MFKHELGTTVREKVTGFEGKIIGRTEWLYGCRRYTIQSSTLHEGKPVDPMSFDEDALEPLGAGIPGTVKGTGGPHAEPPRRREPR